MLRAPKILGMIAILTALALIGGCSSLSSNYTRPASVDPASIIRVNQTIVIPENSARAYIQDGRVIAKRDRKQLQTFCSLQMQKLHATGEPRLVVSPGQFEITRIRKTNDYAFMPIGFTAFHSALRDRPSNVIFEVQIRLKSAEQPGVRALICTKHVNDYGLHYYPTLAEIRMALGETIEIINP